MCACRGCYLLFTADGAGGCTVPCRARPLPIAPRRAPCAGAVGRDADPGRASPSSSSTPRSATSPRSTRARPGATESLLPLDAWGDLVADQPGARRRWPRRRGAARARRRPRAARPSASSCRSTPATSWSGSCVGCGRASTEAPRCTRALDAFFATVGAREVDSEDRAGDGRLTFEVVDARAERYAAQPTLALRLRVVGRRADVGARRRPAVPDPHRAPAPALRGRRGGAASPSCSASQRRWGETLRPFLWTHVGTTVGGFIGSTEIDLAVPCTYDMEVAGDQVPPCPRRRRRRPAGAALLRHLVRPPRHGAQRHARRLARGGHLPPPVRGLAGHDGPSTSRTAGGSPSAGRCSTRSPVQGARGR